MSGRDIAADLRRIADLVESGQIDGRAFQLTYHVPDIESVEHIATLLGGEVTLFENSEHLTQAHITGASVGGVRVVPIGVGGPWVEPKPTEDEVRKQHQLRTEPVPGLLDTTRLGCTCESWHSRPIGVTSTDQHRDHQDSEVRKAIAEVSL